VEVPCLTFHVIVRIVNRGANPLPEAAQPPKGGFRLRRYYSFKAGVELKSPLRDWGFSCHWSISATLWSISAALTGATAPCGLPNDVKRGEKCEATNLLRNNQILPLRVLIQTAWLPHVPFVLEKCVLLLPTILRFPRRHAENEIEKKMSPVASLCCSLGRAGNPCNGRSKQMKYKLHSFVNDVWCK
jgi:hypothetical protein